MTEHIRHLLELGFTVVADPSSHYVDFEIYDIVGHNADTIFWQKIGAETSFDPVDTLEQAEIYLHGSVKWDGCSNWHFDEQERCMLHGCSKKDVQRFGDVMAYCWSWAIELLPTSICSE